MANMSAALLEDGATYRRTQRGARELVSPSAQLSAVERRFLAVVTGQTPLVVLVDLIGNDPALANAIVALHDGGFIRLERDPPDVPIE